MTIEASINIPTNYIDERIKSLEGMRVLLNRDNLPYNTIDSKIVLLKELMDDFNKAPAEEKEEPKLIGTLTKPYGQKGYETAEIGHQVFEFKDRYLITIKHETLPALVVPFYKETLSPFINKK